MYDPRMKKLWTVAAAAVCLMTFLHAQPRAQKDGEEAKRLHDATTMFDEIMDAQDKAIPTAILSKATGIAIFPSTIKAGLVVGGMRGRGVLSGRTADGWSSPAFLTLTGGSFGLQIGGESADIILVINGERGLQNLVCNQFKIGTDAALAAGPVGRDAQASTDIQLRAQILSYSRARSICRRDDQWQHNSPGPGCKPALLRKASDDQAGRDRWAGGRTGSGRRMACGAREIREIMAPRKAAPHTGDRRRGAGLHAPPSDPAAPS